MKSVKLLCNCAVILLFAGLSVSAVVAQTTKKEQVEKVYGISPTGSLVLSSSRSNIEILTWDRNEVKVVGELSYPDSDNKEDVDKLLKAFKSVTAESSNDVLNLNLRLIKSTECRCGPFLLFRRNQFKTILQNDDVVSIDGNKIQTSYTIWIPANLAIVDINSRYGKLNMASVKGNVNITLSNNDMVMGDFDGTGNFDIRYSTVTIGSGDVSRFNVNNSRLYIAELKNVTIDARYSMFNIAKTDDATVRSNNDTFDVGTINNISIDSRYSKFNVTTANNAIIRSNNDKFVFEKLNDIDANARYSTIQIENNAGKSKFDFNNSKLFGKNFQTMEILARYSEFNVADIGDARITSSNQSIYNFAKVNAFLCQNSRYDTFIFGEIVVDAAFQEAYQTTVNINRTSASFTGFSGHFRYGTINLKLNPNVEYNLNYDGTYGGIDIPTERFKHRLISEKIGSSRTSIQAATAADAKCNIVIVANNVPCIIE